jgi:hypothetical protein
MSNNDPCGLAGQLFAELNEGVRPQLLWFGLRTELLMEQLTAAHVF